MSYVSMATTLPYQLSNFFMYGWSFQDLATSRQQRIGVNVSTNSIAHMLRLIKKIVSKKGHVFMHLTITQIRKLTLTLLATSWRF